MKECPKCGIKFFLHGSDEANEEQFQRHLEYCNIQEPTKRKARKKPKGFGRKGDENNQ